MAYGTDFLKLLQNALETEELKLRTLADRCEHPSLESVYQFDEGWIKYLLAIEQMGSNQCPQLEFETGRIDACFLSDEGRPVAAFELKGPLRVPLRAEQLMLEVIEDFRKQSGIAKPGLETYVVLLLHGTESELANGINEIAQKALQVARVSDIETSRDIQLNLGNQVLRICSFEVEA